MAIGMLALIRAQAGLRLEADITRQRAEAVRIAQQAGVSGTPTVQLFFEKEMKQQWRGVKQRREFRAAIDALIPHG